MNDQLLALRESSIRIIKENQANSGAYIASPNFKVYNYSWFRDGAFIADAMSEQNENASAVSFHTWATHIILEREEKIASLIRRAKQGEEISPDEHLHCRYTTDGRESEEIWTNLQLDGFGTWIWSLDKYLQRGNQLPIATYRAVESLVGYLTSFWRIESYDWWEESFGHQHVANLGSIAAGLQGCSRWENLSEDSRKQAAQTAVEIKTLICKRGLVDGRLAKWIDGTELDASLLALIAPFNLFEGTDSISRKTVAAVMSELGTFGTYRHKEDGYFGGGRWPLLSCFLGLAFIEIGQPEKAVEILQWVETLTNEDLELPEQLASPLLYPAMRAEWIQSWGEPAVPLLWSHAMYLSLQAALNESTGKE
ncbi:MAG: glycoside hydrolase family 15 [Actinobacteria bacterium]|nr:glycoside hydrolase family 15 [Actinomycetota bacterium]